MSTRLLDAINASLPAQFAQQTIPPLDLCDLQPGTHAYPIPSPSEVQDRPDLLQEAITQSLLETVLRVIHEQRGTLIQILMNVNVARRGLCSGNYSERTTAWFAIVEKNADVPDADMVVDTPIAETPASASPVAHLLQIKSEQSTTAEDTSGNDLFDFL